MARKQELIDKLHKAHGSIFDFESQTEDEFDTTFLEFKFNPTVIHPFLVAAVVEEVRPLGFTLDSIITQKDQWESIWRFATSTRGLQ